MRASQLTEQVASLLGGTETPGACIAGGCRPVSEQVQQLALGAAALVEELEGRERVGAAQLAAQVGGTRSPAAVFERGTRRASACGSDTVPATAQ